jgi:uncharacterized protein with GYD domain
MPTYVVLVKWTDQGRRDVANVADRIQQTTQEAGKLGVKPVAQLMTMGRYDQVVVAEAPDDETMAKVLLMVAGRGAAETETMRAWSMDEVRSLL